MQQVSVFDQSRIRIVLRGALALLLALVVVLGAVSPASGMFTVRKISGVLPPFGDVSSFWFSHDGKYAVFSADRYDDDVRELYSVRLPFGEPVMISDRFSSGGGIISDSDAVVISGDSQRVVYHAKLQTGGKDELFSVPIDGSEEPVKLNVTIGTGGNVDWTQIAPNGQWVVYMVSYWRYDPVLENYDLWSVPITGGGSIRLGPDLAAGRRYIFFEISPNSQRVVYLADPNVKAKDELFSVPISEVRDPITLNGELPGTGGDVVGFAITPNSLGVVFRARDLGNTIQNLFSNEIDGGDLRKLTNITVDLRQVADFAITPDSARVVYAASQDTTGVAELYSTPISTSVPVKLSGTLATDYGVNNFSITPNGEGVAFLTCIDGYLPPCELFSNFVDGHWVTPFKLNGDLTYGGTVGYGSGMPFAITPNSGIVVYMAEQDTVYKNELYGNTIYGTYNVKLSGAMQVNGDVSYFRISNNAGVVYLADQDTENCNEIYYKAFSGGLPVKMNAALVSGGGVVSFQLTPNGQALVYVADQDEETKQELYYVFNYGVFVPVVKR